MLGTTLKISIIALALVLIALLIFKMKRKGKNTSKLKLDPVGLWKYHQDTQFECKKAYGAALESSSKKKSDAKDRKPTVVLEFVGDVKAKRHRSFGALVDEVYVNREKVSEVVVVITSPGGMVPHYGHAFSQMERLRDSCEKVTVCIDVVAASGGYLMSLPAHKILAAPFSIVGSVGVVAFVPNLRKMLLNFDIEPRTFTAGKHKRTVGLFDDAAPETVDHFRDQLDTVHRYFLGVVKKYRPEVNFEEIETGSHWSAQESVDKNLGLVDEISCSEEYLIKLNETQDLVFLSQKTSLFDQGVFGFSKAMFESIAQHASGFLVNRPF